MFYFRGGMRTLRDGCVAICLKPNRGTLRSMELLPEHCCFLGDSLKLLRALSGGAGPLFLSICSRFA